MTVHNTEVSTISEVWSSIITNDIQVKLTQAMHKISRKDTLCSTTNSDFHKSHNLSQAKPWAC